MLQCGLLRSNFSLAIVVLPFSGVGLRLNRRSGAGSGNRTRILSLEGCCTTIVLYPQVSMRAGRKSLLNSSGASGGRSMRVVGEVGLEPTKAYASGFTVRPLCRSGHSPARAFRAPCALPVKTARRSRPLSRTKSLRLRLRPMLDLSRPSSRRLKAPNRSASYSVLFPRTQRPQTGP